jgi:hypothetical protein
LTDRTVSRQALAAYLPNTTVALGGPGVRKPLLFAIAAAAITAAVLAVALAEAPTAGAVTCSYTANVHDGNEPVLLVSVPSAVVRDRS